MFRSPTLLLCLALSVLGGCKNTLNKLAADMTGDVMQAASPKLQTHWDTVLFGDGIPGLLLLLEGVVAVSPNNDGTRLELAKSYCLYTYGWVEDAYEKEEVTGNFDKADVIRKRGVRLYLRARDMGLHIMRERDSDIDEALKDAETLRAHLKQEYHRKKDAGLLFWTAMGWGSAINIGRDNPMLVSDLGTVKVFAERIVELDPEFFYGAPLALAGALEAALPAAMGGDPEKGKALFERSLEVTDRENTIIQVQFARTYAMVVGDRPLYEKLMNEALTAEDPSDPELRMSNEVARERAERYLKTIDADL